MTGDELKAERLRRGLTQVEFAEMLGISQPRLSVLEAAGDDTIPVQLRTMDRILDTLAANGRPTETAKSRPAVTDHL